jgi:hypothetical protein
MARGGRRFGEEIVKRRLDQAGYTHDRAAKPPEAGRSSSDRRPSQQVIKIDLTTP